MISLLLSALARLLLSKRLTLIRLNKKMLWNEVLGRNLSPTAAVTNEGHSSEDVVRLILAPAYDAWQNVRHAVEKVDVHEITELLTTAIMEYMKNNRSEMSEIVKTFVREDAVKTEQDRVGSGLGKEERKGTEKEQELIGRVLLVASDAQTVTGLSIPRITCTSNLL